MNKSIAIGIILLSSFLLYQCDFESNKQGRTIYNFSCAPCHMEDGTGLIGLYPPLAKSDYLMTHIDELPCLIRHGIEGKIIVNNKEYDEKMEGFKTMTESEITNLVNYIRHSWGNNMPNVNISEVQNQLGKCP